MPTKLPPGIQRDLEFAIEAARAAGRASPRRARDREMDGRDARRRRRSGADGFLQGIVRGRYPDDGILSEETRTRARASRSRACGSSIRSTARASISQLRDDWAVHVALTIDGKCALAAVALPSKGPVLWGVCLPGLVSAGVESGERFARPRRRRQRLGGAAADRRLAEPHAGLDAALRGDDRR
jgi:fructose-1,6-bisphosphatase/inositol monophosphatase family enzyme